MSSTVAQMSKKELAQVISTVVEQKLVELFGDPDDGIDAFPVQNGRHKSCANALNYVGAARGPAQNRRCRRLHRNHLDRGLPRF